MRREEYKGVIPGWRPTIRFSVRFWLRVQRSADVGSIVGSITFEYQRVCFSLGVNRIPLPLWDANRQRMLGGTRTAVEVNQIIDGIVDKVFTYFHSASSNKSEPSLAELTSILFPERTVQHVEKNGTFILYFKRFIKSHTNRGRQLSKSTIKNYGVVLNSWIAFEKRCKKSFEISDFRSITRNEKSKSHGIIERYERFLTEVGLNGTPTSDNTKRKYVKVLSTFLRWCENETGVPMISKLNVHGDITSKHTFSLTDGEVARIERVELIEGSKLDIVRDMMLLAIYTGLRHSEWLKVRPELWREPSQLITSQKTGKVCLVVHREPLRRILRKYEKSGFRSSIMNIQKVNTQLKEVCKLSGLDRIVSKVKTVDGVDHHQSLPIYEVISTHTFRRTKITLELNAGRSLRDIVLETGQDEMIARKHYDRPNIDDYVKGLGIERLDDM